MSQSAGRYSDPYEVRVGGGGGESEVCRPEPGDPLRLDTYHSPKSRFPERESCALADDLGWRGETLCATVMLG